MCIFVCVFCVGVFLDVLRKSRKSKYYELVVFNIISAYPSVLKLCYMFA